MNLYETLQNADAFYMPPSMGFLPNSDEEKDKNSRFNRWLDSQKQIDEAMPTSIMNELMREAELERDSDEFGFYMDRGNIGGSQLNEIMRESEYQGSSPVYDFSITNDVGGNVSDPTKTSYFDMQGIMFRGQSTWGYGLFPDAEPPEILELSGQNAQTSVYIARRMRGYQSENGIFTTAMENSPYLQKWLTPNEEESEWLNKWADGSPTFYNAEASMPLSAYWKDSVIDVLGREPTELEKDWDPKKAIEELKVRDPKLASYVFETIGMSEDRLEELATTPRRFRYFIADSIDFYAFTKYMADYTKRANFADELATLWISPMLVSSLNSNDTLSEAAAVAGGAALATTVVGAPAGVVLIATATANKAKRIFGGIDTALDLAQRIQRAERYIEYGIKANRAVKTVFKYLPGQITDTAFEALSNKIPALAKLTAKETDGFWATVGKFSARTAISEFFQGMAESVVGQTEYIQNGFSDSISVRRVLWNGVEEAIGAPVLGGIMKGANRSGKWLVTDNILPWTYESFGMTNTDIRSFVSPRIRNRVNLIAGIINGIQLDGRNLSVEEEARIISGRYRLNEAGIMVNANSNLGNLVLDDADEQNNPLVATVIDILSGGNPNNDHIARATLVNILTASVDRGQGLLPSLTVENAPQFDKNEVDHLAFMQAQRFALDQPNGTELSARLTDAAFKHYLIVNGLVKKNKDGNYDWDAWNKTDPQEKDKLRNEFGAAIVSRETAILSKLGIGNIDELNSLFLSPEQLQLLDQAIQENGTAGARVDLGNLPTGTINTVVNPPTPAPTPAATPAPTATPAAVEPTAQADATVAPQQQEKTEQDIQIDALISRAMQTPGNINTNSLSEEDKNDLNNCRI